MCWRARRASLDPTGRALVEGSDLSQGKDVIAGMTEGARARGRRQSPWDPPPSEPLEEFSFEDFWPLAKQIDGLGGEWSFSIFVARALTFHRYSFPPLFYEPLSSFDRLGLEAHLRQRLDRLAPQEGLYQSVSAAFEVFPSIFDAEDGIVPLPEEDEPSIGRHSVTILGVSDQDTLVFRNSWGGWNTTGIGYLTREYFDRYCREAWVSRDATAGPMAETAEQLLGEVGDSEFARLWLTGRRRGAQTNISGRTDLRYRWFESWSLNDEASAEVIVLELNRKVRVGTAVLIHYHNESVNLSVLSELFIWPTYRRQGYGRLLESIAVDRSKQSGSFEIAVYLWDADAVKGKEVARQFLQRTGYSVEEFASGEAVFYGKKSVAS
jgi:GNAT superfamily N-acetyltransferase